jgi:peptide/nickel transport system substrate-binding protein
MEAFVVTGGTYVYGSYPHLDGLYREQASELDKKKRDAILQRLQQLLHEKTGYAPIWELAFLNGVWARASRSRDSASSRVTRIPHRTRTSGSRNRSIT